jgi:23S rRNA U2552 (ribose-2'-O)-methylase RlmE/FtsJ
VDRAAAEELHEAALRVSRAVLRPGGTLVLKGFPGPESDHFRSVLRSSFARVSEVRPEGKRRTSKEFYWVATGEPRKPR